MNIWGHFSTITRHKIKVGQLCFKVGLYKQGLLHDLSKYAPVEFMTGVKYYKGTYSPNAAERQEKGYSLAWLHHKGRNMHHWEFWVDFTHQGPKGAKMPYRYLLEMFCDRVAASMIYQGKKYTDKYPLIYYQDHQAYMIMNPESQALLDYLLTYMSDHGLEETIALIRSKHGYEDYPIESEARK